MQYELFMLGWLGPDVACIVMLCALCRAMSKHAVLCCQQQTVVPLSIASTTTPN